MPANPLFVEGISRRNRTDPVSFGIPCAKDELPDAAAFRLSDGKAFVP